MSQQQLVVMLFDSQGKKPAPEVIHEYTWVGDANGGTYIRAVTKSYPVENKRKGIESAYMVAMDEALGFKPFRGRSIIRAGEGMTNTVPARRTR